MIVSCRRAVDQMMVSDVDQIIVSEWRWLVLQMIVSIVLVLQIIVSFSKVLQIIVSASSDVLQIMVSLVLQIIVSPASVLQTIPDVPFFSTGLSEASSDGSVSLNSSKAIPERRTSSPAMLVMDEALFEPMNSTAASTF